MNNLKLACIVLVTFIISGCSTYTSLVDIVKKGPSLKAKWVLTDLDSPESVIASSDASFLYVSNVNGDATDKDGNGYISKVSLDGKMIEKKWAVDLDAPKGLALMNNALFVSDIDTLVIIDTTSGETLVKTPIADAKFLNDVVRVDDSILISDSATATIHQLKNAELTIWMQDERLNGVNGLHSLQDDVLITTMESGTLYKANKNTKALVKVADGMKNADGIGVLEKNEGYFISSWPGELHHIDKNGMVNTILDTEADGSNMNDLLLLNNQLIIPNWSPGSLSSYTVK